MDYDENIVMYDDVLKELKQRIVILKKKCSIAQQKLENKVSEISFVDKDIEETEHELSKYESKTKTVREQWEKKEIEIEKLKWMQEKASIILESNRKKIALQSKTMDIIKRNHLNLTTRAYETVRQETVTKIINNELYNLSDSKKELENKLFRLQKTKNENQKSLVKAETELIAAKARGKAALRLRDKLKESEVLKLNAISKLNDLKMSRFRNIGENLQLSRIHS